MNNKIEMQENAKELLLMFVMLDPSSQVMVCQTINNLLENLSTASKLMKEMKVDLKGA